MRAILLTKSGGLSNRSFLQGSSAAGRALQTSARCSMRSSTCCERDAPGDSCPTTFHRRAQSTITFERGPVTELSNEFTTFFVDGFVLQRAETRSPARRALTANRQRQTSKGGSMDTMPGRRSWVQASHPGGHHGADSGCGRSFGRYPGSGRGEGSFRCDQERPATAAVGLGRRRLRRQIGGVGQERVWLGPGDRETNGRRQGF